MNILEQKIVVLGVTGCIAAYKSAEIVRGLQRKGVTVKVIMTENAQRFIAPLTFQALTGEPVITDFFDNSEDPIPHISLGQQSDALLIAPCTANTLAEIAHGLANDLLTSTALAATVPLLVAPAMNEHMYNSSVTQANMALLRERGVEIVDAEEGYLACGTEGRGHLADVDIIVEKTLEALAKVSDLEGKKVMITAGPTQEPIDPVRYISNHSSGKMAYALAEAARARGAEVILISGPVCLETPSGVKKASVTTAEEMLAVAEDHFKHAEIAIFAAAVCDMRPVEPASRKLKKDDDKKALAVLDLVENPDIIASLAKNKRAGQFVVGFAAETDSVIENGARKLRTKNADLIVANEVGEGLVFGSSRNKAYLIDREGAVELEELPKRVLADRILDRIVENLNSFTDK